MRSSSLWRFRRLCVNTRTRKDCEGFARCFRGCSPNLWLASFAKSWFYSDSLNDVPLLERVTHPVAVDPDDTLQRIAHERGWPVISLH